MATTVGLACSLGLAVVIVIESRNLGHFDPALVAYTFATLFATFGIARQATGHYAWGFILLSLSSLACLLLLWRAGHERAGGTVAPLPAV